MPIFLRQCTAASDLSNQNHGLNHSSYMLALVRRRYSTMADILVHITASSLHSGLGILDPAPQLMAQSIPIQNER